MKDFGLSATLGELLLVVGDYRDPERPKIQRPGRLGGDDDFLVRGAKDSLYDDVRRAMAGSKVCRAYLKKKAPSSGRAVRLGVAQALGASGGEKGLGGL